MAWSGSALISEIVLIPGNPPNGIQIDGYLRVTKGTIYPAGAGPILTDQLGGLWLLSVNNIDGDAVLITTPYTPG